MSIDEHVRGRAEITEEFNVHEKRSDGAQVLVSLCGGLTLLRDALYARAHEDVERVMGMDSTLSMDSLQKTERIARTEIEIYQVSVSAAAARSRAFVSSPDNWYVQWLSFVRLGQSFKQPKVVNRLEFYLSKTGDARRLAFTNVLAYAVASSRRAPLVLFRLHPLAVEIATALAFGDHVGAITIRRQQISELPIIRDCHKCRGQLLENGEQCRACGNPLWTFDWLSAAD